MLTYECAHTCDALVHLTPLVMLVSSADEHARLQRRATRSCYVIARPHACALFCGSYQGDDNASSAAAHAATPPATTSENDAGNDDADDDEDDDEDDDVTDDDVTDDDVTDDDVTDDDVTDDDDDVTDDMEMSRVDIRTSNDDDEPGAIFVFEP
jgi:hypothetical protein